MDLELILNKFNRKKTNYHLISLKGKFKTGLTLIELLITIAVSTILIGVILLTLKTVLDTYYYVQDEVFLQKIVDETLQVLSDGDFDSYGIKDSLEILKASRNSITFVPLWIDDGHFIKDSSPQKQKFYISCPFKAGASFPIGEVLINQKKSSHWEQYPMVFYFTKRTDEKESNDFLTFNSKVPLGAKVRFVYQPDATYFPDSAMTIQYKNYGIVRTYRKKKDNIPKQGIPNKQITNMTFQYFDNMNNEILPNSLTGVIAKNKIQNITAVKLNIKVGQDDLTKKGSVFINLRNTFASGSGLIIKSGTKINVPNSNDIRAFSLSNLIGIEDKGKIVLEVRSSEGQSWKVNIELGTENDKGIIHRYSIEYPAGQTVYSEKINLPIDQALNFLTLGSTGRYDYDLDENVNDVVNLKGIVELSVLEMDAAGAALHIRP